MRSGGAAAVERRSRPHGYVYGLVTKRECATGNASSERMVRFRRRARPNAPDGALDASASRSVARGRQRGRGALVHVKIPAALVGGLRAGLVALSRLTCRPHAARSAWVRQGSRRLHSGRSTSGRESGERRVNAIPLARDRPGSLVLTGGFAMVYGSGRTGPGGERAPSRAAPAPAGRSGARFGPRALRFSR